MTNSSTFPMRPSDWTQVGVVMIGEPEYGEDIGGLQAPHVTRWGDPSLYHMFYGSWWSIFCQATSEDGKHFTRVLDSKGKVALFTEGGHQGDGPGGEGANTRDPMLFAIPAAPYHPLAPQSPVRRRGGALQGRRRSGLRRRSLRDRVRHRRRSG
eukprot:COSAG06_NODE_23728_length_683_cov_0.933219_2_plen_153_part_01